MRPSRGKEKPAGDPRILSATAAPAPAVAQPEPAWRSIATALGLTPLILVRPWLDGVTYPTANFYFVWGGVVLACLFVVRMLMQGAEPRFKLGTLFLCGFWLIGLFTLATTVQIDATYRAAVIWAGYLFLFMCVVNGVRTRAGFAIVFAAFLASVFIETAYSLFHFRYILPLVRETVLRDPYLVRARFGTDMSSAELAHRLQVNRAFGSLLFPNALAAFVVLSLPVAAARTAVVLRELWTQARARFHCPNLPSGWLWVPTAVVFWLLLTVVAHAIAEAIGMFEHPPYAKLVEWRHGPLVCINGHVGITRWDYVWFWCIAAVGAPLAVTAAMALILKKCGYRAFWLSLQAALLVMLLPIEAAALWLTFSRGGMFAIAGAIVLLAALMAVARSRFSRNGGKAVAAASIMLLMLIPGLIGQGPPPVVPQEPAAAVQAAPPEPVPITKEGVNLTATDMMNPASFRLRISYWRTGLRMAADNFWAGVGLGNFGTVYPNYKQPGAGEVRAAHNDYLQVLCETGVFGFALFAAFWGYFLWWGAARICRERDVAERWILLGLYGGLLAFLAHSLVDFNFFNPALSFFAFLAAGLFVSRALLDTPDAAPARPVTNQIVALPLLVLAALICGMGLRVYMADLITGGYRFLAVGDDQKLEQMFSDGQLFFPPAGDPPPKPKPVPARHLAGLAPDTALQRMGNYLVREGNPPKIRLLRQDEPIPSNAYYAVADVEKAKNDALPYVDAWLELLQRADRIYPYDAKLSAYFMKWYDLLVFALPDGEARRRYILEYTKWAQETVERSPREFQYRNGHAKALWLRANIEPNTSSRRRFFEEGLEAYRQAMLLYPASPDATRAYGQALIKYGQALSTEGAEVKSLAEEGARLVKEGEQTIRRADELQKKN